MYIDEKSIVYYSVEQPMPTHLLALVATPIVGFKKKSM